MVVYPRLLIRYEFKLVEMNDEWVAVAINESANHFHGMIKLGNKEALFMFKKLQDGISLPELIKACMDEYHEPVEQVGPVVMDFLDNLKKQELLLADKQHGFVDNRNTKQQP